MVQTVQTITLHAGQQKIFFEKPHVLSRIFISIQVLAPPEAWAESRISFDDPMFYSYYTLAGYSKYFEAKGEGIFQGDMWVFNNTTGNLSYTISEILI